MIYLKKKFYFFFLYFLVLILPLEAGVSLGLFAGQSLQKPSYKNLEFNSDTRWVYGVRAGFKLLTIGVDAQYFQVAHHLQLQDIAHSWQGKEIDFSYLGIAIKAYFSLLLLHPYLSIGYGNYKANLNGVAEDSQRNLNFGAGFEISLGEKLSLQAEGRYHRSSLNIEKADFKLGDFVFTAGLNFIF